MSSISRRRITMKIYGTLMLVMALLTVLVMAAAGQEIGVENSVALLTSVPADYLDAGVVVTFSRGHVHWDFGSRPTFSRHSQMQTYTKEGVEAASTITIELAVYDKLDDISATIERPGGLSTKVDKPTLHTTTVGDVRIINASIPGVEAGDVVGWDYKIGYYTGVERLEAQMLLLLAWLDRGLTVGYKGRLMSAAQGGWKGPSDFHHECRLRNLPSWYFDSEVYTVHSEFIVDLRTPLLFGFLPLNLAPEDIEPQIVPIRPPGNKRYIWRVDNVPPFTEHIENQCGHPSRMGLNFVLLQLTGNAMGIEQVPMDNSHWARTGYGLLSYVWAYCEDNGSCRRQGKRIASDLPDEASKVDSICAYVSRYLKQDTVLLGLRPLNWTVDRMLKKKKGAAFEVNLVLMEMLRGADLEAWPVFISTCDQPLLQASGMVNHMIVMVELDGRNIFLDACQPDHSAGFLPEFSCVDVGLLIKDKDLAFCPVHAEKTPTATPYVTIAIP
jgi:hypothetical protein